MTGWDWFLIGYLVVGVILTMVASSGHMIRFGYPMHWITKVAGVFAWPAVLLIGGWKD